MTPNSTPSANIMELRNQIHVCASTMIENRRSSEDQGRQSSDRTTLLFTGLNQHQVPHNLLFDQHLSPNEKTAWQIMKALSILSPKGNEAPRRTDIASAMNCTEQTVTKARQLLRLNRWLTFCQRVRDNKGRIIGDIYLMHEEPWPLWETMLIDSEYALFIKEIESSETTRYPKGARRYARETLAEIQGLSEEAPIEKTFLGGIKGRLTSRIKEKPTGLSDNFDQANLLKNIHSRSSSGSSSNNFNNARTCDESQSATSHPDFLKELSVSDPDYQATFIKYFPELGGSKLTQRYASAFWFQQAYLPIIRNRLMELNHPGTRLLVIFQIVGKIWATDKGLTERIRNFPPYLDALIARAKKNEFQLDDYGHQVRKAHEQNDPSELIGLLSDWKDIL